MKITLQTKIFLLIIMVFLISISIAGYFIVDYVSVATEKHIANQALDIARTVASIPDIQNNLGKKDGSLTIDPLAEEIRKNTNTEFVVVIDRNSIRYSHPIKDRVGKKFVGNDEKEVLKGKEYVSNSIGTLGPSLRAFVPVYQGSYQVGAVSVGILLNDVEKSVVLIKYKIIKSLIIGLLIGFLGAAYLARNIKKAIFGLEPIEIATIFEEKQVILSAIREGIIAINKQGLITVMNEEAKNLLGLKDKNVIGLPVTDVVPNTELPKVLKTGIPETDQPQLFFEHRVITSRVPLIINGEIVGAVASFRNMTEVQKLAEELTGVKRYVDALRAQSHEFKNKLHTIAGLLQLGKYNKALNFIMDINEKSQDTVDIIVKRIKDPLIGGLLLGKLVLAKEKKIKLIFDKRCNIYSIFPQEVNGQLISILGNLIDNAFEAVDPLKSKSNRKVRLLINETEEEILIEVEDWGIGIAANDIEKIFNRGFTTKGTENRGIGLALIKNFVKAKKGTIAYQNKSEGGASFQINIPKERLC